MEALKIAQYIIIAIAVIAYACDAYKEKVALIKEIKILRLWIVVGIAFLVG